MSFIGQLRKATPQIDVEIALRQAIQQARHWGDLEVVVDQLQPLVDAHRLSREQSDNLTALVRQKARALPEQGD